MSLCELWSKRFFNLWLTGLAGYGRVKPVMAGLVGVWPSMAWSGRLWPGLAGSWLVMTGYGTVWLVMTGYGRVLAGYGRVLAGIAGYARYASTSLSERGTPSSRSSRSGDHQCPRRDSPEYDRCDGRVVSRKYSDEPSPRQ
ncbi:hypothetical protein Tco_0843813 [Tanacetum coccineum]